MALLASSTQIENVKVKDVFCMPLNMTFRLI